MDLVRAGFERRAYFAYDHTRKFARTHTHTHPQSAHTRHACVWSEARRVRALSTPASPVRRPAAAAKYSRLPKIRARGAPRAGRGTGGRRPPRGAPGSTPSPASERRPATGARPHVVTLVVRCCLVWPHWMAVAPIFENVPLEVVCGSMWDRAFWEGNSFWRSGFEVVDGGRVECWPLCVSLNSVCMR